MQTDGTNTVDRGTQTQADIKELAKMLVDPEAMNNAVYIVKGDKYMYSKRSLFFLKEDNPVRKCLVHIVVNPWFDHFITTCIILNSIALAARDYRGNYNPDFESD